LYFTIIIPNLPEKQLFRFCVFICPFRPSLAWLCRNGREEDTVSGRREKGEEDIHL
jgi:hypothetical protein